MDDEQSAADTLAGRLIDAWVADKGRQIPWAKAVQIVAIVTKQPDAERDRLLRMGDEDGSCEMCGRRDPAAQSKALADIASERQRQIEKEGWTPDHDDEHHTTEEMAIAAACYALNATWLKHIGHRELVEKYWPWDIAWWKPKDPRRDLVRAGALIVAEIERLDRAQQPL